MNATNLFDRDGCSIGLCASSESFWTTLFSLFLLHLGRTAEPGGALDIWEPTGRKPWFRRKPGIRLDISGLTFDDLAVESTGVATLWSIETSLGGICPDTILRLGERFAMIEAKARTGRSVNKHQELTYPAVADLLRERGINCMFLLLMSVGHQPPLYRKAQLLNVKMATFGLLLWEDVFRTMQSSGLNLPGFDVGLLTQFMEDAKDDCENW